MSRIETDTYITEGIKNTKSVLDKNFIKYTNTRSAYLKGWYNGSMIISTRFGQTLQLHQVFGPGGYRKQLTYFDDPIGSVNINPNSKSKLYDQILFCKDIGGNEKFQIYIFDMKTSITKLLTDGKSKNGSILWNTSGLCFAFNSTMYNGKDRYIYIMDPTNYKNPILIIKKKGLWYPYRFSPDDRYLVVMKYNSVTDHQLWLYSFEDTNFKQINPSKNKIAYGSVCFDRDSRNIFFTSDQDGEFKSLKLFNIETNEITSIDTGIKWNIESLKMSYDGKILLLGVNEDGVIQYYKMLVIEKTVTKLEGITHDMGTIYNLDFIPYSNNKIGFNVNSSKSAGDCFTYNLETGKSVQWTFSEVGGLDTSKFISPTLIHFKSFDNLQVPAFYYKPTHGEKHPVIIYIHGGPESQFRPGFNSRFQYLIKELGLAILAPNVRGSSGYGKTYLKLDNWYKREDSVRDIGALIDWIKSNPDLDSSRIIVDGGSYGGYMVLASLIHFNDTLLGGIDRFGISNFITFLENTSEYRRDLRRVEYGDERISKMKNFLEEISPLNNAQKISKPILIAQGINDPRVPVTESNQIVKKIRKNCALVQYIVFKNEGHGFKKKKNIDMYKAIEFNFIRQLINSS